MQHVISNSASVSRCLAGMAVWGWALLTLAGGRGQSDNFDPKQKSESGMATAMGAVGGPWHRIHRCTTPLELGTEQNWKGKE
jgi:hypothetical protein